MIDDLDSSLQNVEQDDFKKIYRAKTPSTQRKNFVISTDGRNLS